MACAVLFASSCANNPELRKVKIPTSEVQQITQAVERVFLQADVDGNGYVEGEKGEVYWLLNGITFEVLAYATRQQQPEEEPQP